MYGNLQIAVSAQVVPLEYSFVRVVDNLIDNLKIVGLSFKDALHGDNHDVLRLNVDLVILNDFVFLQNLFGLR